MSDEPDIYTLISKKYGDIIVSGTSLVERPKEIIPASPAIDLCVSGGFLEGSLITLSGNPKAGKTGLALCICKNAQKQNRNIYYLNIEGRLRDRDLLENGLDPSKINVIGSTPEKLLSGENYLNIAEDIIRNDRRSVIVFDSVSQLCVEKELVNDIGETGRNPSAILMASFCRKVSNLLPINNNLCIAILHLIANTSGYGPTTQASGGRKIQYQADYQLRVKGVEKWLDGDKQIGQKNTWICESSPLGPPGRSCLSYLLYGYGISEIHEVVELGLLFGIIQKKASWFSYSFDPGVKIQGQEKLVEDLKNKPEILSRLQSDIKQMIYG